MKRRYKIGATDRTAYLTGKPSTWAVFDTKRNKSKPIASGFVDSEAAKRYATKLERQRQ